MELVIGVFGVALCVVLILYVIERSRRQGFSKLDSDNRTKIESEAAKATEAQEVANSALQDLAKAEVRLEASLAAENKTFQAKEQALKERDEARQKQQEAEKQIAVTEQKIADTRQQMVDWEKTKKEFIESANAAGLNTGTELSKKLFDDFKREREADDKRRKESSEDQFKAMKDLSNSVATLKHQVAESKNTVDTVWRALQSPAGVGQFAEVHLENTLKSFGLEKERDFIMQYAAEDEVSGNRLFPDAVVFLPGDSILVIDAKASKFLIDLAEAEGTDRENEALGNFVQTMRSHLKSLKAKEYNNAVMATCRKAGHEGKLKALKTVMYMPHEGALEKLARGDEKFLTRSASANIIPCGPFGLAAVLSVATIQIDLGRQAENHEEIIAKTERLLEGVAFVIGHVDSVGKGIKSVAERFSKFTGSVNSRLLPRVRDLEKDGVRSSKAIPNKIPQYLAVDRSATIEGEAEEILEEGLIADQSNSDKAAL